LCAFSYNVWADGLRPNENKAIEHGDIANVKQEKFAGRANNIAAVNGQSTKTPNVRYPLYTQDAHEKKPLSKDEKRALRRQISETENMYPKRVN
jgi:hypothetical protein